MQHLGETSLKEKINEHLSCTKRNHLTSPVARHFMKNIAACLYFFIGIETIKESVI